MTLTIAELEACLATPEPYSDSYWELIVDLRTRKKAEQEDDAEFSRLAAQEPRPTGVAW